MIHSQMIVLINLQAVGQDDASAVCMLYVLHTLWMAAHLPISSAFVHLYTYKQARNDVSIGQLPLAHVDKHTSLYGAASK